MERGEIVVTNVEQDEPQGIRGMASVPDVSQIDGHAALAVPLEGDDGRPLGAIALYDKRDMVAFSEEDKGLLVIIAANASTAIRLQLSREAREHEDRLTTIGRLLSGVIHDLKTPLTVISGYVQLMQTAESKEQRDEYADHVLKQFDHISAMQREVLEFARGEKSILIRKVYLAKFFGDVRDQLEKDFKSRDIELVVDIQDKGTARFDEGKMLRVIHNLSRNAAEAMADRGGKFTITVKKDKATKELVVSFADNGPGIPKEIEHRLFQSFATSGKKGGTGLGLAIVKKIAEEHGGSIVAHSSRSGVTFELRIPLSPPESAPSSSDR
jgi:signal transduction histidine kinase